MVTPVSVEPRDRLDPKTRSLVCLGALVATGGRTCTYDRLVADARAAGASDEDVVGALLAVASTVGLARLVSATTVLALSLGYDVDAAFELLDDAPAIPEM